MPPTGWVRSRLPCRGDETGRLSFGRLWATNCFCAQSVAPEEAEGEVYRLRKADFRFENAPSDASAIDQG
jgi:hypothetical protein